MRFSKFIAIGSVLVFGLAAAACGGDDDDGDETSTDEGTETTEAAPDDGAGDDTGGAAVNILAPSEGEEVTSPVTFELEAEGVEIEAVPDDVSDPPAGVGHFHILVDYGGCYEVDEAIPTDAEDQGIYHFGDGTTEPVLEDLEPGEHEVCVQVADQLHTALDLTAETTITVAE